MSTIPHSAGSSRGGSLRSAWSKRRPSSRLIRSFIFRQSSSSSFSSHSPLSQSSSANLDKEEVASLGDSRQQKKSCRSGSSGFCGFRAPTWLFLAVLLIVMANLAEGFDIFDMDCPDNSMRKPPRFGKRSQPVADIPAPGSNPDFEPPACAQSAPRVRRASSDCFRGPLRSRTLRQSPGSSMPSLSSTSDINVGLMNQLNSALFRSLLRASLAGAQQQGPQQPKIAHAQLGFVPIIDQSKAQSEAASDEKPVMGWRDFLVNRGANWGPRARRAKDTSVGSAEIM